MTDTVLLVAAALAVATGLVLLGRGLRPRSTALDELLAEFEAGAAALDDYSARLQDPLLRRLLAPLGGRLTESLQGLLPRHAVGNVRRRLVLAGLAGRLTAEEYVAAQVVGAVTGALLGLLAGAVFGLPGSRLAGLALGLGVLGLALPALVTRQHRDRRVEAIERELPDVLDVLAISVEAGVGLEGAIQAVVERFDSPLAHEFAHTLSEMELGLSRREALQNLRARTDVPDLNGFVLALLQADALGMPMTRVLQTQADEMRRRRRQKVREAAAKLPVKLVFPLVVFILPSLFVVILGPAIIRIAGALGG